VPVVNERNIIAVPDIGDFRDVEVIEVLVGPGDVVGLETPLITLETDKATMDIPATAAGRVVEVLVGKGSRVSQGDPVVSLEPAGQAAEAREAAPATVPAETASEQAAAAVEPAASATGQVPVPDIGDFQDVEVIEVLVAVGDQIELETPLVTLETDKATMDVPSTVAGRVAAIHVAKGARVNAGDLVVTVAGAPGARAPEGPTAVAAATDTPPPAAAAAGQPAARVAVPAGNQAPIEESGFSRSYASPSVRRFARELGVDLGRVSGTGQKGRVTREDVKSHVKAALAGRPGPAVAAGAALPAVPEVDFASYGTVDVQPLTRIQRISGPRLHASWVNVPHVTQHDEADITDMEALRASLKDSAAAAGVKLTPLAFIVRACARVLAGFPRFNASLDAGGQNLVFKKYLHLGFAADTPNGLVVPVIRDADRKDLYELARDLAALSGKARDGRLSAADMQGGCFTISSLGGIGGTAFTPIINAPEVAILGVSRAQMKPVWRDGEFVPRLLLPLSLSYDHRVIDGAAAARFTVAMAAALAEPRALLEAVP
jgi:pyruvate dehydrogenase E2 component (dihydrolipoamide acetyltransferase)